jgi:hypothetical protein
VEVVSSEHRTTGGDGAVLSGSLGLLAGVVTGLVQTPGVRRIDALLDVVEGCEERQLDAGANGVIQACVSSQNAGGVESRLLEDLFLQVATERCASRKTGDGPDVMRKGGIGIEVPVKNAHGSPGLIRGFRRVSSQLQP